MKFTEAVLVPLEKVPGTSRLVQSDRKTHPPASAKAINQAACLREARSVHPTPTPVIKTAVQGDPPGNFM